MKRYIIYGTTKDWYFAQCGPEPFADNAATREEAVAKIAEKFYGLFKEVMNGIHMEIPKDPDELRCFLTGDSDETDEYQIVSDDNGMGVSYEDYALLQDYGNGNCNTDNATTMVLGISEFDTETGEFGETLALGIDELLDAIITAAGLDAQE